MPATVLSVAAMLLAVGSAVPAADELTDALRQAGLRADYSLVSPSPSADGSSPSVSRISRWESVPTVALAAGEAPDSRLPASGWKVRWTGVIEILQPGSYRFGARASGRLQVRIAGQTAIELNAPSTQTKRDSDKAFVEGEPLELAFGLHPLEVEFQPDGEEAELKLFWESEHFGREPLGARSVGHAVPEAEIESSAAPPASVAAILGDDPYLIGRLAFEEHSCVACHRPADAMPLSHELASRPGPHLTDAGARLKPAWIYHWLGDPHSLRPEAVMPRLFAATRNGDIERQAVAHFLGSQQGTATKPPAEPEGDRQLLAAQGQALFERTGCIACHRAAPERPARATLRDLGQKTTAGCLATFLENPAAIDPAGRMPSLKLSADEAAALACYLTDPATEPVEQLVLPADPTADELRAAWLALGLKESTLNALTPEQRLGELGRQVMHERRCTTCHELKGAGDEDFWRARPAQADFAQLAARTASEKAANGCLKPHLQQATHGNKHSAALPHPNYADTLDRDAVQAFLAGARTAADSTAPAENARLALARFNCQACHERDGIGGLAPDFVSLLSVNQSAEEAESIRPPTLSGITHKLLAKSLDDVLTGDRRSRPWMSIRMPRFGKAHVGQLAAALATLEGTEPADQIAPPEPDSRLAEVGRQLVGSQGFGCTKCHDLLGRASGGTRGPDLAQVAERIQYGWYLRWMTDPQRIETGTRMPTVFLQGESPYPNILEGDPELQRQAIWQYLVASRDLPLPEGFDQLANKAESAGDRVLVARTFLPNVSPRGMAIRFPSRLHLVYDAQSCRLAAAWRGDFLDMTPVWTDRGGRQARLGGPGCWTAPPGFAWEVTAAGSSDLPSFAGRATDTTLGAPLPDDAQFHPSRLHFRGYHVDDGGATFRYDLSLPDDRVASFSERLATSIHQGGERIARQVEVVTPEPAQITLHVADVDQPPQIFATVAGELRATPIPDGNDVSLPADTILGATDTTGAAVYRLREPAKNARWRIAAHDGRWQLCLQLPTSIAADVDKSQSNQARANLSLEVLLPTDGSLAAAPDLIGILNQSAQP